MAGAEAFRTTIHTDDEVVDAATFQDRVGPDRTLSVLRNGWRLRLQELLRSIGGES